DAAHAATPLRRFHLTCDCPPRESPAYGREREARAVLAPADAPPPGANVRAGCGRRRRALASQSESHAPVAGQKLNRDGKRAAVEKRATTAGEMQRPEESALTAGSAWRF